MRQIGRLYFPAAVVGIFCLFMLYGNRASAATGDPCAEDIAKFCKDAGPDGVMACLEKHESELSEACRTHEEMMGGKKVEMREEVRRMKIFRELCKEDMAKFCGDVKPEQGGIEKCLRSHEGELSSPCSERLKAMQEEGAKQKTP
jgi:hypothetical protein